MPRSRRRREGGAERSDLDPLAAAERDALALLTRRDHASTELARKLRDRGHGSGAVAVSLERLAESGALDDARYVANFLSFHAGRGQGPRRIRAELAAAAPGLPAELLERALAETDVDFVALCRQTRLRRFGPEIPEEWAERARQARFLQYRGFSSDHIRLAMGSDVELDDDPD